jgi:tetratricopeptide (TPR) repeat protein
MSAPYARRVGPTLLLLALLATIGGEALASERGRLTQARRQYMSQEYERVVRLLAPLVQSPLATISEKVEAYELLGLSYLILGDTKLAREAFENLLGLDPGHQLRDPSDSPKLRMFFESVKEAFVPGYKGRSVLVTLEHSAPTVATAGRRAEFGVLVAEGGKDLGVVQLRWRRAGLVTYEVAPMTRNGQQLSVAFLLPADATSYKLEYYFEARDTRGQVVTRLASPERPMVLVVGGAPRPPQSIFRRWWFWTIIGVAVVGVVTAGAVVGSIDRVPEGNLGTATLR